MANCDIKRLARRSEAAAGTTTEEVTAHRETMGGKEGGEATGTGVARYILHRVPRLAVCNYASPIFRRTRESVIAAVCK